MAEKSEKKYIKLTVTSEMYDKIQSLASRWSLSIPSFCCFVLGQELDSYRPLKFSHTDENGVSYFIEDDGTEE